MPYEDLYPGGSPPDTQWFNLRLAGGDPEDQPTQRSGSPMPSATPALNLAAVLAVAAGEPEQNPRSDAQEVQAMMYRDLQRLVRRVYRLEQLS